MQTSAEFGKKGEQLAVEYLETKGYEILHRNYRYLKAEIDIIARKNGILAIVEVKSRSSEVLESAAETVTKKKIRLLVMAADNYVIENKLDLNVRFDIITVIKKDGSLLVAHTEDAFYHF